MNDQLAARIKIGDEQAFELLFRRYYTHLCMFASKYVNDPDLAKEIVQEVFCNIWEDREDINPDLSLKSYIYKITKNLCINKLHRRKVESRYSELIKNVYLGFPEVSSTHESLCAKELEEKYTYAVSKLPRECRKVFELSRIEGLKYREIAETLNISIKTVEGQMAKAFRILRIELIDFKAGIVILLLAFYLM
jgi:RNA polymerase sigma-70 factor, ECF subfamily